MPRHCDQIVPENPAVSRWQAGVADSIGVDVEAADNSLNVTLRGTAWERALERATACHDARQCDACAPPIPRHYQVRVHLERSPSNRFVCPPITFGEPASSPECAYHHYLTDRTGGFLPLGWPDYWGPPLPRWGTGPPRTMRVLRTARSGSVPGQRAARGGCRVPRRRSLLA